MSVVLGRSLRLVVIAIVTVFGIACGSSTTTPSQNSSPLTGTWDLTSFNGSAITTLSLELKLVQANTAVTGTYDHIAGTVPAGQIADSGTISGVVTGSNVSLNVASATGLCPETITAVLSGNQISGSGTGPSAVRGGCIGAPATSTLTFTKQAP